MQAPRRLLLALAASAALASTASAEDLFDWLQHIDGLDLDDLTYYGEAVLDVPPADTDVPGILPQEEIPLGLLDGTMQTMQENGALTADQADEIELAIENACQDGSGMISRPDGNGGFEVVAGNSGTVEYPDSIDDVCDYDNSGMIEASIGASLGLAYASALALLEWELQVIGQNVAAMVQQDAEFVVMCGDTEQGLAELAQLYGEYYPTPGAVFDEYIEHAETIDPALIAEAGDVALNAAGSYAAGEIVTMMGPAGALVVVIVVEAAIVVDLGGQILDAWDEAEQADQVFLTELGGTQEELDQLQEDYEDAGATGLSGYGHHFVDYYFSWL